MSIWTDYFNKTKNAKPRPYLVEAIPFVKGRDEALDLGSGALNDVRYLLSPEIGFRHLTAVDKTKAPEELTANLPPERFTYMNQSFEDFNFPSNFYDLVNAQLSLPFNPQNSFNSVFTRLKTSLKKDGILTGQLFGNRDEWNTPKSELTFHSKEEALALLADLEVIKFVEEEKDGSTAAGVPKHWHVFNFIVRK